MKKIFYFAAAALAVFGCQPKEAPATPDSIELSAESKTVDNNGGSFSVMVTSSTDWTLEAKEANTWAHPGATSGSDGDIVKFTVDPNTGLEDLSAVYVFKAGKAQAELSIVSLAKELDPLEVDRTEVAVSYEAGEISLNVKAAAAYRDIKVSVDAPDAWLAHVVNLPGVDGNDALLKFSYQALEGLDDRSAVITVSAENAADVTVNVLQEAKHVLAAEKQFYTLDTAGETVDIPLSVNVEYSITVAEEGAGWLSAEKTESGIKVTATAIEGSKRSSDIVLAQTDAKEGEEALVYTLTFTQTEVLISWAADMAGNRLFPKWDGTAEPLGYPEELTLECLFRADEFNNSISTLMGIEGDFLLRLGDSAPKNVLQLATMAGNLDVYVDEASSLGFETNRWYHVAVTLAQRQEGSNYIADVKVYIDGQLKAEKSDWTMKGGGSWWGDPVRTGINMSKPWSYESDGTRCFWIGYAYDANRDLKGQMTEIRIWNKILTEGELNAENHFYNVDPKSEGLYSYWKFAEGEGSTIADATGNGNKLYGETNVRKQGNDNIGDEGISWAPVALPDR